MSFRFVGARAACPLLVALLLVAADGEEASAGPDVTDRETARSLMWSGDQQFEKGDHTGALQSYRSADAIMNVPTTGLAVAKAHNALRQLVEARDKALLVARSKPQAEESPLFPAAREAAAALAAEIAGRLPTLRITVEGLDEEAGYEVIVDGTTIPSATAAAGFHVDPKTHTIIVRAAGFQSSERRVVLEERAREAVRFQLSPATDAPVGSLGTRPDLVLMYSGFSLAGAALTVGAITGGVSVAETDAIIDRCGGTRCSESERDELASATTLANVSNGAFAAAGVGLVLGIVGVALNLSAAPGPLPSSAPTASARGLVWVLD